MTDYRLLIGGKLVAGDRTMTVINPATEEALAECPCASVGQVDDAVAAAKAAFPGWAATEVAERRKSLGRLADAIEAESEAFAKLLTQEQGKPLDEARGEIAGTIGFIRYFAGLDLPIKMVHDDEVRRVETHRKPLGVVAAIIPWNFPVLILAFKIPPALLAGNTVVIKPAPTTPLTALLFGKLCEEIFPAGVVNVVTDQNDLGAHLTSHPDVRKVSFTGSSETGRKVYASAAASLKRITLELGGNDAAIVLDDVDPKRIAPALFAAAFTNAGQVCLAVKRLYVQDGVYDKICDELAKLADEAVVDDGLRQGAQIGPLQNRMQYEKVQEFVADARANGTIIAGGVVEERPGYFIRPTIVRDVMEGSRIVDEEQFGPVLPIIRFADPEDALARANASPHGLGGSVWSSDADRGRNLAFRMKSGTVWVNKHLDLNPDTPFGGAKESGIGLEFGEEGLAEFTQLHVVNSAK